MTKFLQCKTA